MRLRSKSVALHCAKSGYYIRCNSVHPTFIDTPILDKYRDRFGDEIIGDITICARAVAGSSDMSLTSFAKTRNQAARSDVHGA